MTLGRSSGILAVAMAMAFAGPAATAGQPGKASSVRLETGVRYWYSTGDFGKKLHYADSDGLYSQLVYDHLDGQTGEIFFRADHVPSGWFVKGNAGGGVIERGELIDEDFPPSATYSKTTSEQHGGDLAYFTLDVGRDFVRTADYDVGLFGGYNYFHEFVGVYGCTQLAAPGSGVCEPAISTGIETIEEDADWHSLRLGLSGRSRPADWVTLNLEAALIYSYLDAVDHHLLRSDINPTPETGWGPGLQLEAVADFRLNDRLGLGIGARFWQFTSRGIAHFPNGYDAGKNITWSQRLGVFVQLGLAL